MRSHEESYPVLLRVWVKAEDEEQASDRAHVLVSRLSRDFLLVEKAEVVEIEYP